VGTGAHHTPPMAEIHLFRHARDVVETQPGMVLFRSGEPGDVMFAVLDGEVQLTIDDRVIDTLGPGAIFGEMSLVDHSPRSATAAATTPGRVARVDQREFMFLVQEHPTFALEVMKILVERIRRANQSA
jgi:CRP/FNR family transcriptional regulator, cyclic AMP receptor protein